MDLDLDFLKSLISDFDLMALLPDLAELMGNIMALMQWILVAGPLVLAFMGLWYLVLPAKEANHVLGYRFFWGMGSVKSWKFTQRLAGLVWLVLGAKMAFEAYTARGALAEMETLDMMYQVIETVVRQTISVIVSCLVINLVVFLVFNFNGGVRRIWLWIGDSLVELIAKLRAPQAPKPAKAVKTQRPARQRPTNNQQ